MVVVKCLALMKFFCNTARIDKQNEKIQPITKTINYIERTICSDFVIFAGFAMYTTCVIWLAFVPLYFGTANHVALRITSMSVTISLSASVTLVCLFSPKVGKSKNRSNLLKLCLLDPLALIRNYLVQLYIILIRPERNVRQSMMPMRYSAFHKGSGTTGSGGADMLSALMVTAATCDQKQQIQKHVPPIEVEGKLQQKGFACMKVIFYSGKTSNIFQRFSQFSVSSGIFFLAFTLHTMFTILI